MSTFSSLFLSFLFFNDTATTEIYTLSLHDALPISHAAARHRGAADLRRDVPLLQPGARRRRVGGRRHRRGAAAFDDIRDRKSTRLNSSHLGISYAVFCLKKKKIHEVASVLSRPETA